MVSESVRMPLRCEHGKTIAWLSHVDQPAIKRETWQRLPPVGFCLCGKKAINAP